MEIKHNYEQRKSIDDKENEKKIAIEKEVEKQQQLIIWFVIIVLTGVFVFLIIIFHRLKITRKQKIIIEEQKFRVEEAYEELNQTTEEILAQRDQIESQNEQLSVKNTQITDSINYASHIQQNILNSKEDLSAIFGHNVVFQRPKDIVPIEFPLHYRRRRSGFYRLLFLFFHLCRISFR